jgi:predicted DsbA family dithiol-disulfide isomerase
MMIKPWIASSTSGPTLFDRFAILAQFGPKKRRGNCRLSIRWLPFEIHPETPPEGAPKPFPLEAWPQVRARLERLGRDVGLPIDPPKRNVNSRFALETTELVRAQKGDDAAGAFYHDVSRAFFTEQADI